MDRLTRFVRKTTPRFLPNDITNRGYRAKLFGIVETKAGKVTRLDLVARGLYWGEGTYTRGAPEGEFPFAVAFTLSPGDTAVDRVLPGAARSYLK